MELRITTFNLENLYSRYSLLDGRVEAKDSAVQITGVTSIDWQGTPLDRTPRRSIEKPSLARSRLCWAC